MDIVKTIRALRHEKKRLDHAIAQLETFQEIKVAAPKRVWNAEARRRAAERMKKYWEKRRAAKDGAGAGQ